MIIVPALKVGFQAVPKVGTTSIYFWMFDLCALVDGKRLQGAQRGREHFQRGRAGNLTILNEEDAIEPYEDYFRFAFYRDPIKRFLSMYRNRVVFHRELAPSSKAAPMLEQSGLAFNPQPNELVARLHEYMANARSIDHHARPQIDFIGPDTSVFTRLADLKVINQVLEELRGHWRNNGMSALADSDLVPGREQAGGPKLGLEALSEESFEKLLKFYRADYQAFGGLSVDAIRAEYRAAVASQPAARPVVFWGTMAGTDKAADTAKSSQAEGLSSPTLVPQPAPASAPAPVPQYKPSQSRLAQMKAVQAGAVEAAAVGGKLIAPARVEAPPIAVAPTRSRAATAQPRKAETVGDKPAGAGSVQSRGPRQRREVTAAAGARPDGALRLRLTLKKQDVPAVALLRTDFPRGGTLAGEAFALGGQCLLNPECDVADYALQLRWPGHLKECVWELNSPGLAEEHPDNKNSPRARFKVAGIKLQPGEQAELLLRRRQDSDEQLIAALSLDAA